MHTHGPLTAGHAGEPEAEPSDGGAHLSHHVWPPSPLDPQRLGGRQHPGPRDSRLPEALRFLCEWLCQAQVTGSSDLGEIGGSGPPPAESWDISMGWGRGEPCSAEYLHTSYCRWSVFRAKKPRRSWADVPTLQMGRLRLSKVLPPCPGSTAAGIHSSCHCPALPSAPSASWGRGWEERRGRSI